VTKRALAACLLEIAQISCDAHAATSVSAPVVYTGMCDASAAVALTEHLFAVASDEDSVIRVYSRDQAGAPVQSFNLSAFLDLDEKKPESDLEGAARIGDRAYWITSHGRNRSGRARPSRKRFFATQISTNSQGVRLKMIGKPYERLLDDLVQDRRLARFNLGAGSLLEPKARGGVNIEGLSATPDGHLLIGFRNPIPGGKALLVPMLNPDEVVQGRRVKLGEPLLLDLDGLGIRDMAYSEGKYLIIAGPYDGIGQSHLYEWSGGSSLPLLVKHSRLKGLNPEGIVIYPDKEWSEIQIISDDGKKPVNGRPCKECPPSQQHFRSVWVKP